MITRFAHILVLSLFAVAAMAQEKWALQKDDGVIRIYTRPMPDSDYNALLAVMQVDASVRSIYDILINQPSYRHIFPDATVLKVVKRINDTTHIQYVHTDSPWPVSDRDGVFQQSYTRFRASGFQIRAWAVPDLLPENEGIVRIRKSRSYWTVTKLKSGLVEVRYEVNTEPGGNIPAWMADFASVDLPYRIFNNLRNELNKEG